MLIPMTTIRLRLIDGWHRAWRWSSIRFLAAGATIQGVVVTCPAAVSQHVPEWVWQVLSCFALACMIAAGLGRVTTTEPSNVPAGTP